MRAAALALFLFTAASCTSARPEPLPVVEAPPPPAVSPWPGVFAAVRQAVDSGRYGEADRILNDFAVAHAGTQEATESEYWRAALKADPANRDVTPSDAIAALDAYLAGGETLSHYLEATLLRRTLVAMDSLRAAAAATRATAETRDKEREEELLKLNEELAATKAELERIRRRLTKP